MSNLIKTNNIDELPERLKKYAVLRVGKKSIKDLHPSEIKRACAEIYALAHSEFTGELSVDNKILLAQTEFIFNELSGKFKDLTICEIRECFKMGIREEFGKFYGLCAKTYNQFIKGYYERPERAESMRVYLDVVNKEITKELTPEEKRERIIKGIYLAYETFCKCGELPFYSAPYYDIIKENGLVNWTKEQRSEMEIEAKTEYIGKLTEDKKSRKINTIQFKVMCESLNSNQTYKNVCKKVALKRFFEVCKLSNVKFELK